MRLKHYLPRRIQISPAVRDWVEPLAEFIFITAAFVAGSLLMIGFRGGLPL